MWSSSPPTHLANFDSLHSRHNTDMSNTILATQHSLRDDMSKLPPLVGGFLFTPPENMADSFPRAGSASPEWRHKLPPLQKSAPSPPITPETRSLPGFDCSDAFPSTDAPLFPNRASSETPHADAPLFGSESQRPLSPPSESSPRKSSATSDSSRPGSIGRVAGTALPIEYSPAGARAYYDARMDELNRYRAKLPKPTTSSAAERDVYSKRQLQSLGKPVGVNKSRATPRPTPKLKAAKPATSPRAAVAAPSRRTPKTATLKTFIEDAFPRDGQTPKHKRAAPSKKVDGKDEDRKWREIPDYCPPMESLNVITRPLRADWKAEPRDISREADADALNPAEYHLASGLRLLPQQYLANKRRMFQARLQHLKDHKNFTKTAAQLACNIDVNKASSLWEAFNRVGWFEERWFQQWL